MTTKYMNSRGRDGSREPPPHRSGLAELPHPAPASGDDAQAVGLSYPLESGLRTYPALRPEHAVLSQVPLSQPPSLHPLRSPVRGVVRELLRYYEAVRLPASVHRHRMPFGLRAAVCETSLADGRGISRFPNMTLPCVLGVSDHGEPLQASRFTAHKVWPSANRGWRRHSQCGLFEIPYPARSFPCQRFDLALRFRRMTRGRVVRYSFLVGDSHPSPSCRSSRRTTIDPRELPLRICTVTQVPGY